MLIKKSTYLLCLISLLLISCNYLIEDTQPLNFSEVICPSTYEVYKSSSSESFLTSEEINNQIRSRKERFEGTLALEANINNISDNSIQLEDKKVVTFSVQVYMTNKSNTDLVLYIPRRIGFRYDSPATDVPRYDLYFQLFSEAGEKILTWGSTELQNVDLLNKKYVVLPSKQSICMDIKLSAQPTYTHEKSFLVQGKYYLLATYQNYSIGPLVPIFETPPPDITNLSEWYNSHEKIVDLDAWIGTIESTRIDFEINK